MFIGSKSDKDDVNEVRNADNMDYLALSKEVAERTHPDRGWQDSQQEANNIENEMEHYEMSGA